MTDTQHPEEQPESVGETGQEQAQQESARQEASENAEQPPPPSQEGKSEQQPESVGETGQQQGAEQQGDGENQPDLPEPGDGSTDTKKPRKKALALGLGSAGVVVIVALALAAFVWPGFLAGPGKPDSKAEQVVTALGSKNPGQLEQISCHSPEGKSSNQIPPQALSLIQSVKQTGPVQLSLDTEAQVPIDLTLNAQGKTQTAPANAVLGVTDGDWCMKGLSQRQ